MNASLVTISIFVGVALLVGALISLANDLFFHYRFLLAQRMDEFTGRTRGDGHSSLFKDLKQLDMQASAARPAWRTRFEEFVEQSGLGVKPAHLVIIAVVCGVVTALLAMFISGHWWMAPIGLLPGLVAPAYYVRWKRARRLKLFTLQIPEAFDTIGRAVQAGQTVPGALQIIGDDFPSPIADEFRNCTDQQSLGIPHDVALRGLARRTGIMEIRILVVALLVQARAGGDLVELLHNLSAMARGRLKLQQKIRATTGEGRMQALVLMVLPFVAFLFLLVISPTYVSALLNAPLLLCGTIVAQCLGALWIRRIVTLEY